MEFTFLALLFDWRYCRYQELVGDIEPCRLAILLLLLLCM